MDIKDIGILAGIILLLLLLLWLVGGLFLWVVTSKIFWGAVIVYLLFFRSTSTS